MRSPLRNHDEFDLCINCEIIITIKPINIQSSCLDSFHGEMPEIYHCSRVLLYNVMFPTITTMLDTSSPQLILKRTGYLLIKKSVLHIPLDFRWYKNIVILASKYLQMVSTG